MRPTNWMSPLMVLLACATAQAQVSLAPRRLSPGFQGQVPLLWVVEGSGTLRGAKLQLLDEAGKDVWTWQDLGFRNLEAGRWQAWSLETPGDRFKDLPPGRYTLVCRMVWERNGQLREEETETPLILEGRGDGWLQKAFQGTGTGAVKVTAGLQWPRGGSLDVKASPTQRLRKMRYQIISDQDEKVLRSWTDLPLKNRTAWSLAGDTAWPEGPAVLWVLLEGLDGQAWVESREVWLGRHPKVGAQGGQPGKGSKKPSLRPAMQPLTGAAYVEAPTVANAAWLRQIEDSGDPLKWDDTNRVATVGIGYWDVERNETNLFPTAAQAQWRPMSLSLTGANGLGKPLYGVSYLLAAGTNLDTVVDQATQDTFVLPQGAQTLQVGGALAPVVMSAGTVEDFLGKPLAAGYGWAATKGDAGVPGSGMDVDGGPAVWDAWSWSQQTAPGAQSNLGKDVAPPVGLNAIMAAARYRTHMQTRVKADVGNVNPEADLDATRDPYALSFASPDPMGRAVIGKGLGARKPELADSALGVLKTPMSPVVSNLADNFDGELNNWYTLGMGAKHAFLNPAAPTNGSIQLSPDYSLVLAVWFPYYLGHYPAGTLVTNLGLATPGGGSIKVNLSYQGTMTAKVVDDGGTAIWSQSLSSTSMTAMAPLTLGQGSSTWVPTIPTTLRLVVTNATPTKTITTSDVIPAASYLNLDNLSVSSTQTYQGLEYPETTLDNATRPALAGYSRTQIGTVEKTGNPMDGYGVSMVTDADGSGVAEVKDLEGRTVLKIVNPDATYTDAFKEYRLVTNGTLNPDGTVPRKTFRPSAPRTRGLTGSVTSGPQINLVTQYVFDAEGHLRVVIPPKGLSSSPWGLALKDTDINGVLSDQTTDFTGVASRAQIAAKYATFNAYDYAGHLVATFNPDEGLTRFKVDQKGRVHYSQTEKQRIGAGTWTRTLYDGIYRVLAVGELNAGTSPVANLEIIPTYDPALPAFTTALGTLNATSRSQNAYDDYQGLDPTSATLAPGLDPKVRALLPSSALWGAFPDGHLAMTKDPGATERYFYDQDGRIVIRWVRLNPVGGAAKEFAIGIYYDFTGRVKRLVYPSGPGGDPLQVVYAYDDLGRLYAVGTPADGAYFARYAYYPTGEVKAIVYGPGKGFAAKQMLQDPQGWLRELTVKGR